MVSLEADWKLAVAAFTANVLGGCVPSRIDNCEVFDRAVLVVRSKCSMSNQYDDITLSFSLDCIRLSIRRGLYNISSYTSSATTGTRNEVSVLIDEILECCLSILRQSKIAANIISVERLFLALFGMSMEPLVVVAARGGLDSLVALMTPQPSPTINSDQIYLQPLTVIYNTIRVFHFLEIRYSSVLAARCSKKPIQLFQCALDLLRLGLRYQQHTPAKVSPVLPVGESRSLLVMEVLRYCYAALNNHGEKQFVVAYPGAGGASPECTRSVSFWTTPFSNGGADDQSALCEVIQFALGCLPSRHRTVYNYQLLCVHLLMLMPLPLVFHVCSGPAGVLPLLHILRIQLLTTWDLDTDAGLVPQEFISGEKVDQSVAATLVMGYHSEKATIMLMPVFAVLINLCNYRESLAQYRNCPGGLPALDPTGCRAVKDVIKAHILGSETAETAAAVKAESRSSFVPHSGSGASSSSVLRGKLVVLMTSLNTSLKRISGELLYSLCENDEKEFIKWTGYGNAIGLLQSKKGMLEGLQS